MAVIAGIQNQVASPAWRGTTITVTMNGSDALDVLPQISVGNACVIDSSSAPGTIYSIDEYGHSFKVKPDNTTDRLGTGTTVPDSKNTFDVGDSVTVTT